MNTENMSSGWSEKVQTPHELARKNEAVIKEAIGRKFSILPEDLSLLTNDEDGVYFSEESPHTLCCIVVGKKNGFLYLVTSEVAPENQELKNLKCDIIG